MTKAEHDKICRDLVDKGKLIEAGFLSLQFTSIPSDAPQIQVYEMRKAFFAGAQHLWGSIMGILDPGSEPTEKDLLRMTAINSELEEFIEHFKMQQTKTGGTA